MPSERLSKFLSQSGIASRRKCDLLIAAGRVTVNDIKITEPFYQVIAHKDIVKLDNRTVTPISKPIYIALYKPLGYLSDLIPKSDRKVARTLIPTKGHLFPIGRLDYNSEGLIIFTNDGEMANLIMHPKYGIEKEYLVKFKGSLTEDLLQQMRDGLFINGSLHRVHSARFVRSSLMNTWYRIALKEGKNRMIRKIGSKIGHPVLKLKRVRIGPVTLGNLKPGEYRLLTEKEKQGLARLSRNSHKSIS